MTLPSRAVEGTVERLVKELRKLRAELKRGGKRKRRFPNGALHEVLLCCNPDVDVTFGVVLRAVDNCPHAEVRSATHDPPGFKYEVRRDCVDPLEDLDRAIHDNFAVFLIEGELMEID